MECRKEINLRKCTCTYPGCPRKGICCECVAHHLSKQELPGCFFPSEIESTYDRSFQRFVEAVGKK
jgi:hypothetical protein